MAEPRFLDPSTQALPSGWKKIYVKRLAGKSAGKYDAYIYSPDGRKHRSKAEILTYLTKTGTVDQYNIDSFDFTVRSVSVAEGVDCSNSSTSDLLQAKVKILNRSSSQENVHRKSQKNKVENGSDKHNSREKIKRFSLENSDSFSVSDISERKKSKKPRMLTVSSNKSKKQNKLSISNFSKSKVFLSAKNLKHSSSFKLRQKLKIKLNVLPCVKREITFTANSMDELTSKKLPDNGLDTKCNKLLAEEWLDDNASERLLDRSVCHVSCESESPELFSDIEHSQIYNDHSTFNCDEDQKSNQLKNLGSDSNVNNSVDGISSAKTFSDLEIAPDYNLLGVGSSVGNPVLEECSNSSLVHLYANSKLTENNQSCHSTDNKNVSNQFTTLKQVHSGLKQPVLERWIPPQSPYNLVEESLGGNPWKVLVTSFFMNSKERCLPESGLPRRTVRRFFKLCPTPGALRLLSTKKISKILKQVTLSEDIIVTIKKFSEEYVTAKWQDPTALYGVTSYGKDSYRMFCVNEWKQIAPEHPKLRMYHKWLWQNHRTLGIN